MPDARRHWIELGMVVATVGVLGPEQQTAHYSWSLDHLSSLLPLVFIMKLLVFL